MLFYLLAAGAALAALGGLYWKVDNGGYERGSAEVRVQWDAAVQKGKDEAEAARIRQEAVRATQDQQATRRLNNEKKRSAQLMASVEAHIKASGVAAQCPIPVGLLDAWNRAGHGPEGERPGAVHDPSLSPAGPR